MVSRSVRGLDRENADERRKVLRLALKNADATPTKRNPYDQKYQIDVEMIRTAKNAIIRSIWIVKDIENFPRLITRYIPLASGDLPMKYLDVVALTQDLPELSLNKGQVGTIVEVNEPTVFEAEFMDFNGQTSAISTLNANQLMQLYYAPLPQTV